VDIDAKTSIKRSEEFYGYNHLSLYVDTKK
jgi:hypothetical protein